MKICVHFITKLLLPNYLTSSSSFSPFPPSTLFSSIAAGKISTTCRLKSPLRSYLSGTKAIPYCICLSVENGRHSVVVILDHVLVHALRAWCLRWVEKVRAMAYWLTGEMVRASNGGANIANKRSRLA